MSHDEMADINRRLDQIYKDLFREGQEREKRHDEAHKQIVAQIEEINQQNKRQFQMLEPMYAIFKSVKGFNGISVWILKTLILLGAGIAVLFGFIKWLKS